jgi:hypothetical protein
MDKYVICQGSGGLIHMLGGIVYCIEWCKINRHKLIIDVKNHSYFKHNFDDFFYITGFSNYSTNYDSIDKSYNFHKIPLDYIANNNPEYSPTCGYMIKNINVGKSLDNYPPEYKIKIYIGHGGNNKFNILKYIRVKPSIMKIITENSLKCKYTGVHFRNTDRPNNINHYIQKIKNSIHETIYIATDDSKAYNIIIDAISSKNIIQYTKPYDGNGKAIHMVTSDHYQLIINILIDMYNLYNGDEFIDSPSSLVSQLINYMRLVNSSIFID